MSLLAPLFLLGLAGIAFPLVFHLIRRTPRGRVEFSSLMFLQPSPPRLTRRSRLDQWLLLLLRAVALALLAAAFTRPFWRQAASLSLADVQGRRIAILVDVSASMQRPQCWQQALAAAREVVAAAGPQDEVALLTFDERVRTEVPFRPQRVDAGARSRQVVLEKLEELAPAYRGSSLGAGLVAAADSLLAASDGGQRPASLQVVAISDFQRGNALHAVQNYDWPEHVRVSLKPVSADVKTSAVAQLLNPTGEEDGSRDTQAARAPGTPEEKRAAVRDAVRVRVANSGASQGDQFRVHWAAGEQLIGEGVSTQVAPGTSRVVRLPRSGPAQAADRIVLSGDDDPFNSTYYVAPRAAREVSVLYVGSDSAGDAQRPRYFLEGALLPTPERTIAVRAVTADEAAALLHSPNSQQFAMAVATEPLAQQHVDSVREYLRRGGTFVWVLHPEQAAAPLADLFGLSPGPASPASPTPGSPAGTPAQNTPAQNTLLTLTPRASAERDAYVLMSQIDFAHPLFAPFRDPQYSDFTGVRFWKHRQLELPAALPESLQVVARFDNGAPAVVVRELEKGRAFVWTAGWQPSESQLALSSKFVPLVLGMLSYNAADAAAESFVVGQPLPLPGSAGGGTMVGPTGQEMVLENDALEFRQTSVPGIYQFQRGAQQWSFAVNLAPAESELAPLEPAELEQLGVRLGDHLTQQQLLAERRQLLDQELEGNQKLWRWLLLATLAVLLGETLLAAWTARSPSAASS